MFSPGQCVFLAFDLQFVNGEDLRGLPLIGRKRRLKRLVGRRKVGLLSSGAVTFTSPVPEPASILLLGSGLLVLGLLRKRRS